MIYLDNNATTFTDIRVFEVIEPLFKLQVGNPSSVHSFGQIAKGFLTQALKKTAAYFGVRTQDLIFTSGATEALNLLIRSAPKGTHIISSSLEHAAVMEALKYSGCQVTYLDPEEGKGSISARQVERALQPNTSMIVLMAVNNETGIKTEIEAIARLAFEMDITFIVDAVASLGKEPIHFFEGISALCFSGHKIHAPAGVGLALTRSSFKAHPLIVGGPQQNGKRGGTENLAGIVGFAKALELIDSSCFEVMEQLRNRLEAGITKNLSDVLILGKDEKRIGNTSNMAFLGVDGETLLMNLDLAKLAVSHGSACSSGTLEPSRVLLNMKLPAAIARSSVRFSLSRFTTEKEIDEAISIVTSVVERLRTLRF